MMDDILYFVLYWAYECDVLNYIIKTVKCVSSLGMEVLND